MPALPTSRLTPVLCAVVACNLACNGGGPAVHDAGPRPDARRPDAMDWPCAIEPVAIGARSRMALVHRAKCLRTDHVRCEVVSDEVTVAFLSTYHEGRQVLPPTPVALRRGYSQGVFFDGERVVVVNRLDDDDIRLSRFEPDGTVELSELRVPLAYQALGAETQGVFTGLAGIALAPNDYVIVYMMNVGGGSETHVTRFTVGPAGP
jgi:hypothetical protein